MVRASHPARGADRDRHERGVGCGGRGLRRKTNDAGADGEAVWSWRPKAGAKLVDELTSDGDNKVWLTEESAEKTVKTIAQGRPG